MRRQAPLDCSIHAPAGDLHRLSTAAHGAKQPHLRREQTLPRRYMLRTARGSHPSVCVVFAECKLRNPSNDTVSLYSQRVLVKDALGPGRIDIAHGRIAAIAMEKQSADHVSAGRDVVDCGDHILMAGLIDSHVHVNEPGRTEWEGYESASRAAALGGVTTLCDMPLNSIPVTTSTDALRQKIASAEGKLWVDVGFWGGVVPGNAHELEPMVRAGVRGFKCFLCPSGIDEFPEVRAADLRIAMPLLRDAGVPLLVHAELELPLRRAVAGDPREYTTYLHSRPPEWEDAAVAMIIDLVRETGCRAHIVHLSSAGALPLLAQAKKEGLPITAETCPHYLCLQAEDVPVGDTTYKCAPPIRGRANQEALWSALMSGVLDFVVTDHSPCIPGLKKLESGDFMNAWGGIASLQLGLSAVWSEAHRRGIPISRVHRWMAAGPSQLLGLSRGALVPGARADVVAFDPDASFVVDPASLAHKNAISAYRGRSLHGVVRDVWLAGTRIVQDGKTIGTPQGQTLH